MGDNDDSINNMVSNLPLLFANGYPTSIEKITETQIQKFIPFMVQCSLGNINVPGKEEYNEPEWWPEDIEFSIPITRPKKFQGDWLQKMKEIVKICYLFHKSIFLLRFCNDLAAYEHTWLRFINNHNSTTSLYDRRSNKLLVTFRNENMTYDQPPQKRKCLLQQKTRTHNDNNQQQQMVEQALFDIYLCDNCDAELYSYEAFKEHERICTSDDDDVILCNSPIPEREIYKKSERSSVNKSTDISDDGAPTHKESNAVKEEICRDFLLNFQLLSKKCIERTSSSSSLIEYNNTSENNNDNNINIFSNNNDKNSINQNNNNNNNNNDNLTKENSRKPGRPRVHHFDDNIIDHKERKTKVTRNNRTIYALTRCPNIPFSSPAGQMLIKTFRSYVNKEYLTERLDRVERFCATPILQVGCQRPIKFFGKQRYSSIHSFNCTYKKPQEYSTHKYIFPRRQYFSQYRADSLKFLNDLILKKRCRPITVRLRKITDNEIKRKRRSSLSSCSSNSIINSKLSIKLIRDQSHGSTKWKITPHQQHNHNNNNNNNNNQSLEQHELHIIQNKPQKQKHNSQNLIIVDTIDLCSSDEDIEHESNEEIYINGGLSLAQYAPVQLDIQNNELNNYEIDLNDDDNDYDIVDNIDNDDDDDDDIPQIIDECPAQPEHPVVPLQLNLLTNSIHHTTKSPRIELQTLLQKLSSENQVTVTPFKKILDPLSITPIESSSNIILSRQPIPSTISSNIIEEIRKQNKYEANFLSSNITNNQAKPLQPSVFLFSNYTANSANNVTNNNNNNNINTVTPTSAMILQQPINNDLNICNNSNNQENLIEPPSNSNNNININNLHKNNKNSTEDSIWLPNNSNNISNNNSITTTTSTINNNINNIINNNSSLNHLRQNNIINNSVLTNTPILLNATTQLHNSTAAAAAAAAAAVVTQATNVVATNKLLQLQQLMQYVDNNDVMNKINSPNRTVSIDLTL